MILYLLRKQLNQMMCVKVSSTKQEILKPDSITNSTILKITEKALF